MAPAGTGRHHQGLGHDRASMRTALCLAVLGVLALIGAGVVGITARR